MVLKFFTIFCAAVR